MNDNLRNIGIASVLSLVFGIAATLGLTAGGNELLPTGDGSDQLTAVEICLKPETEVFLVTDIASGEKQYQAKHVTSAVRYDLTWQVVNPEAIAVEELRGADFRPHAEQYSDAFEDCIATKNVVPVQGQH